MANMDIFHKIPLFSGGGFPHNQCDISVSKLFQFFGWYRIQYWKNLVSKKVSDSVLEKKWYQKKYRIQYWKNLVSKKVSDLVSEKIGIEKCIRFGIGKNLVSKKVSESVSKIFGIGKQIRIRFRSDFGYRHTLNQTNSTSARHRIQCVSSILIVIVVVKTAFILLNLCGGRLKLRLEAAIH